MPASLMLLFKQLVLAIQLHAAVPWLPAEDAFANAAAAVEAASPRVSAETLLAIAFVESRYDPTATSRIESGTRRTGHYPSTAPPRDLDPRASLYCGPLQTFAGSWDECVGLRRLDSGYAAGVAELEQWLRDPRVRGNLALALAGHGCGNWGVATGRCNAYPQRVLKIRQLLAPPTPRVEARRAPRS